MKVKIIEDNRNVGCFFSIYFACAGMVLVCRVLGAETFAADSEGAATCFFAVPVSPVAHADVVPFFLAGAAHDLAGRAYSISVLATNTAGVCVSAASWYRTLLPLLTPTMLPAVTIH